MSDTQTPVVEQKTQPPMNQKGPATHEQKQKRRKLIRRVIALTVAVAIVGGSTFLLKKYVFTGNEDGIGEPIHTTVYRSSIMSKVEGSGTAQSKNSATVSPEAGYQVLELFVSEGDFVEEGQLLYNLDDSTAQEGVLTAHGSAPLLYATQNQVATERKILQTLLIRKDLDGILVEGSKTALPNPNLDLYHKLLDQGVRLVFLNGSYPELSYIPSVLADDCGGGRLLVEHLHKKGHQHIGGIFKSDDRQGILRYAGFVQALRDLSLPMEDSQLFWYNTESRKSFHSDAFVDAVLESLRGCSALVCYNDEIALRVVTRLRRKGIAVPGEIAVVSFDNSQYSELAPVRITSLSHGEENLGELAATLLLRTLQEEQCQSQVVPWVLVEKESG